MKLQNKIAIVTAASSGIGLGCAHHLASEGAKVLNADLRKPSAEIEQRFETCPENGNGLKPTWVIAKPRPKSWAAPWNFGEAWTCW
jgi:NAD(P)-dependent dehydrogenase (short-subunit alcohol dehydrogenase family)